MMTEVMRLGDRAVRVAMTPRTEIYWVSITDDIETIRRDILDCPYSRIVAARGTDIEDPIGIIHKRDVADTLLSNKELDIEQLATEALYIPDTTSLLRALEMFKASKVHLAFVVSEYGTIEGVLSPTDLLEMIAGDMNEEHDGGGLTIVKREDGTFLVDGRADIIELSDRIGESYEPGSGYHTVAGLVLQSLGRLPREGDVIRLGHHVVEVIDMDDRRIDKLLFRRIDKAE